MHNLGAMLENGRGTSKNLAEAKFWYERAAEQLTSLPFCTSLGVRSEAHLINC
jgi:TPR repeat protein